MTLLHAPALARQVDVGAPAENATIPAGHLTDDHIAIVMRTLIDDLYRRQMPDHSWEPAEWSDADGPASQKGGYTALATLALLQAGESYQQPKLRAAIEHLQTLELTGTYAVALRTHVWAKLPPAFNDELKRDAEWLMQGFSTRSAGWDYTQKPYTQYADNSLRQYAALALWEASKRGVEINPDFWHALEKTFIDEQQPDGGWNYRDNGDAAFGSMTTAGLATLFITQDELHASDDRTLRTREIPSHQLAIERGLDWMRARFSPTKNPGRGSYYFFYYLYGVERVGLASGYKTFGEHEWFREGAAELIRQIGTWSGDQSAFTINEELRGADGTFDGAVRLRHLAFSLLFLSRGRTPVAIEKARFQPGRWNNRPRDVANIARHLGTQTESELPWQIVTLEGHDGHDDHDDHDDENSGGAGDAFSAPILYLASDAALPAIQDNSTAIRAYITDATAFHADHRAGKIPLDQPPMVRPSIPFLDRLGAHIEAGGFVFAVSEGPRREFAQSMEDAGRFLFPTCEWRTLPRDHWAYDLHAPVRGRIELRGLSNGVRELMILAPKGDLPGLFQDRAERKTNHLDLMMNVYMYASEFNRPRVRLRAPVDVSATARANVPASVDGAAITIGRAVYAGNWNPEPGVDAALEALGAVLAAPIKVVQIPLPKLAEMAPPPRLLVISGVDAVTLSDEECEALLAFARSGGRVVVETVGGTGAFARELEAQLVGMTGNVVQPIRRHPIVERDRRAAAVDVQTDAHSDEHSDLQSNAGSDDALRTTLQVEYRDFTFRHLGERDTTPRLRGMTVAGDIRIIFSREDLSHALLDRPAWFISGYTTTSARALWRALIDARGSVATE
jgi:hypothetical protein